jgi:hypothetical protein
MRLYLPNSLCFILMTTLGTAALPMSQMGILP